MKITTYIALGHLFLSFSLNLNLFLSLKLPAALALSSQPGVHDIVALIVVPALVDHTSTYASPEEGLATFA